MMSNNGTQYTDVFTEEAINSSEVLQLFPAGKYLQTLCLLQRHFSIRCQAFTIGDVRTETYIREVTGAGNSMGQVSTEFSRSHASVRQGKHCLAR